MAASPSKEQISTAFRKAVQSLIRKLAQKGIRADYVKGTATAYPEAKISGANAVRAYYRLIRASNGECAGIPHLVMADGTHRDGFGVFEEITPA